MTSIRLAILFLLALWSYGSGATTLDLDDQDCAKILQKWAENPASVPQSLVDKCKEKMAAMPPPPPVATPAPQAQAVDPCAGPDAAKSVLCWGPWTSPAPAAAGPVAALEMPEIPSGCETGNRLDSNCVATIEMVPPVEGCAPGTPCGFATIVDGVTSSADVEQTTFVPFDLAPDGTGFTVDPNGPNQIDSVAMTANVQPRSDGYENMRSTGVDGDQQSRIVARVVRDEQDNVELAADIWTDGNRQTGIARSGYFAWGNATTQSGLNFLNGTGVSVNFAGPMSVDNSTNAAMTVRFGGTPTWSGTWTNPQWSFGAGGSVTGVNLMSDPARFTANVQSGSFVQGALLGEPGRQGIAHIIDVQLQEQGHIRDVGLLREIATGPAPTMSP
jgi:hypothetical protein